MTEIKNSFLKLKAFSKELEHQFGGDFHHADQLVDLNRKLVELNYRMEEFKKEIEQAEDYLPIKLRK